MKKYIRFSWCDCLLKWSWLNGMGICLSFKYEKQERHTQFLWGDFPARQQAKMHSNNSCKILVQIFVRLHDLMWEVLKYKVVTLDRILDEIIQICVRHYIFHCICYGIFRKHIFNDVIHWIVCYSLLIVFRLKYVCSWH